MTEHHLQLKDETGTTAEKAKAAAYNIDLEETIDYMRKSAFAEYNKRKTAAVQTWQSYGASFSANA